MLYAAVDRGNSFSKAAFFSSDTLEDYYEQLSDDALQTLLVKRSPAYLIISDVRGGIATSIEEVLPGRLLELNWQTPVPINNAYHTPQSLGMDRLAAAIGAYQYYRKAVLVIDAGSCITYDMVSKDGVYQGGIISPGIQMRLRAMHHFTARLPLLQAQAEEIVPLVGKQTDEAMRSGAINGTIAEINGIIEAYKQHFPDFDIIVCGGDAGFFDKRIKHHIFVDQRLVVKGLREILLFNLSIQNNQQRT
jgi:type III pantothenate kinase